MSAPSFPGASVALSVLLIGVAILHPRLCKTAAWSAVFQDFCGSAMGSLTTAHFVLTSNFLHAGWIHTLYNVLRLLLFGSAVEVACGPAFVVWTFLTAGAAGSLISWVFLRRRFRKRPPFPGMSADEGALIADLTPSRGASASTYGIAASAVVVAGPIQVSELYGIQPEIIWSLVVLCRVLPEMMKPSNAGFFQKPAEWACVITSSAIMAAMTPSELQVADVASFWFLWVCGMRCAPGLLSAPGASQMGASYAHANSDRESHLAGAAVAVCVAWAFRTTIALAPLRSIALPLSLLIAANVDYRTMLDVRRRNGTAKREEDIWYGSLPARLDSAPGMTERYTQGMFVEDFSEEALVTTLSRAAPLAPPGTDGKTNDDLSAPPVVVPAVPSVELRINRDASAGAEVPLPPALQQPLIKVPLDSTSGISAVASGVRSALFEADGVWYRLKGCGNGNDGGFTIRTTNARAGAWRDVRGCAFVHTARRELHVSDELARALAVEGAVVANVPRAIWRYGAGASPFGESELFQAVCAVEETRGDRRLGTHVLSGIDILLPLLIGDEVSNCKAELLALFPHQRPDALTVGTAELLTDAMVAFELGLAAGDAPGIGLTWPEQPREAALFAYAADAGEAMCERAPPADAPLPDQWTQDGSQPMSPDWKPLWCEARREYGCVLDELRTQGRGRESVLAYLMARVGHECGTMLRAMHAAGYSWGTYVDAMCFEGQWHCNAHSNNVVVLSESEAARAVGNQEHPPFCACLDFDMAFTARSFVDTQGAGHVGAEPVQFATLLARERLNFGEVLAGGDSTSGVPQVAIGAVENQSEHVRLVRHALHDTLVHCYLRAYDQQRDTHTMSFDPLLHRGSYAVLRMAIVVMAECRA